MEWIKIFDNSATARETLKPDKPQLLVVHGKRICLVLRDNQLLAVEDKCSHNGESLSKGTVNYLGEVVCPLHGHRFSLRTGRESEERSRDLITYPLQENNDGVFIGI